MNIGETYDVYIEKLTNLGLGLAKVNGEVVFVDNACPQDRLKIEITKSNKKYAHGKIVEIIKPSPYRVEPFCPMQKVCGACQIQFIDYDYQLELKTQIVKETLHSIGNIDLSIPATISSPNIKNYRRKIQYPVSQTKNSKRILAGYYKPSTHEIVNIKYCPIQPQICDAIIEFIKNKAQEIKISAYNEKKHYGVLRHIVIRNSSYSNSSLVILVINSKKTSGELKELCESIYNTFDSVAGVCVNFNDNRTNVILGNKTECIYGHDFIEEKLCEKTFHIGAETFFQINTGSAQNIFNYIKEYIKANYNNPLVLDAYAGISAIGICVSEYAKQVVSIEENLKSVELAKSTAELNNIENIEIHGGDAGEYFSQEKRRFDVIILDPPRKGCSTDSLDNAHKLLDKNGVIIYVSCNPATLARDLKYLKEKGMKIESVQPFDMFCHTYHIENVAIIKQH